MLLEKPGSRLAARKLPRPVPRERQLLIRVRACGVCRTDLHIADGELENPKRPLVLGHQIVGTVEALGEGSEGFAPGQRVGVPWLGFSCGECRYCLSERENLCPRARFTGYQIDGGYAEFAVADSRYCFPIPQGYNDLSAAPLLCAGMIGYRALRLAGEAETLGFYGFGASAHILIQVARFQGRRCHVFTRPGDRKGQEFARSLGAEWAGDSNSAPPEPLEAAIVFAPVGSLIPAALKALAPGGAVVCAGIHMSDIPPFPYALLWGERRVQSVANLTRRDGREFLELAGRLRLRVAATPFALDRANEALSAVREGTLDGAAVLTLTTQSA